MELGEVRDLRERESKAAEAVLSDLGEALKIEPGNQPALQLQQQLAARRAERK